MINSTSKKFIAEAIGTFALVAAVCGTILSGQSGLMAALAGGLALMTMIYAVGGISGGHFNPAVSLAATISNRISSQEFVSYLAAQLVGAILAVLLCQTLFANASLATTVATPAIGVSATTIIIAEAVGTFFLALTVLGVTSAQTISRSLAGLAIGSTLVLGGLLIGSLTGAALNPARILAPAIFAGDFTNIISYLIGPFVGAAIAGLVGNVLFTADSSSSSSSSGSSYNNNQNQSRRAA